MPKGFNKKAREGFKQWMSAVMNKTNLDSKEKERTVEETINLLDKGFPKLRK